MKALRLTIGAVAVFAIGCEVSPRVPDATRQNYPIVIKDSQERRAKAEREWRKLLDVYKAPQTAPDLNPIIYTPRSLLNVSGGIRIMNGSSGSDDLSVREAMKSFIERWRELLGADPASLSLISFDDSTDIHRLTYQQGNYPFPLAGKYGELIAVVSADGRLMQLDDRLIPPVETPVKPEVDREAAAGRVLGKTFTYADISGRDQQVTISAIEEITVKRLVVLPIEKGNAIEIRVAWEVEAGKSLAWTVYIDAIKGEELMVEQNFRT
jgi:hypothetical protein